MTVPSISASARCFCQCVSDGRINKGGCVRHTNEGGGGGGVGDLMKRSQICGDLTAAHLTLNLYHVFKRERKFGGLPQIDSLIGCIHTFPKKSICFGFLQSIMC